VMRDPPINGWYAQVVAPSNPKILELQAEVDQSATRCASVTNSKFDRIGC